MIKEIEKSMVYDYIYQYHYSKVMPRINKKFLGYFDNNFLVGVMTLGWGTQPLQTIKKLTNNTYESKDYYEIGKFCLHPDFNQDKNSGSKFLSKTISYLKENSDIKFLYTLADGIVGRVGYVYQSTNFLYGGSFWTDVYIDKNGEKIHPRTSKELLKENCKYVGKDKLFWLTPDFCEYKGIQRIRGKMFRYMYPMNKKYRKELLSWGWDINYPKHKDLIWKRQTKFRKYEFIEKPNFDLNIENHNKKNVQSWKKDLRNE